MADDDELDEEALMNNTLGAVVVPNSGAAAAADFARSHDEAQKHAVAVDDSAPKRHLDQATMEAAAPKIARTEVTGLPRDGYARIITPPTPAGGNPTSGAWPCHRCGQTDHWARNCLHIANATTARLPSLCHLCGARILPGQRIVKPKVGPWAGKWVHHKCALGHLVHTGFITEDDAARVRDADGA